MSISGSNRACDFTGVDRSIELVGMTILGSVLYFLAQNVYDYTQVVKTISLASADDYDERLEQRAAAL